ncbi:uncharacterized protein N7498_004081 [Penicillium cinerascens]|uniref:Uncharacterized protein n=1 Tax=Penicillium cinerascens TaxID=70096 RepID=A0A9W9T8H3_9EURO|nr:uncharacterized protein N7498_004081 [Penicillium cinerascens]KAJ5212435.1 hypothetical protein N7498_004081 [Penicillium cinerascens]
MSSPSRKKISPHPPSASLQKTATPKVSKEGSPSASGPTDVKPSPPPKDVSQPTGSESSKKENCMHSTQNSSSTSPQPTTYTYFMNTDKEPEHQESLNETVPAPKPKTKPTKPTKEQETERTVRYVKAFLDNQHDKHIISLPSIKLKDHTNFREWRANVELRLRMHQVWYLFEACTYYQDNSRIKPLDKDHELYVWYERMVDVAISIIFVSVSPEIRKHSCFLRAIEFHSVDDPMLCLMSHYDRAPEDISDIEDLHL